METAAPASPPPASEPIICRIASWYYYRRMGPLAVLFLVFGGMFLKDGLWGYPEVAALARKKEWFMKEYLPSFEAAKKEGRLEQWMADSKAKGLPTGVDGDVPRWKSYAAQNGWEEDPKLYSEREIAEQFYWAYACFAGALVVGILVLLNKGKVLRAEADHWVTPEGRQIRYADVSRVDKRKWEHQALAYVWYRTEDGRERRAVIDDLKYDGAGRVLERLLSRFSGELIEKVIETESAETVPEEVEK